MHVKKKYPRGVSIKLSPDAYHALRRLAKTNRRTLSGQVSWLLDQGKGLPNARVPQ